MIGLALVTGWPPDVIRGLTMTELAVVSEHLRARRRAQERARRRPGG